MPWPALLSNLRTDLVAGMSRAGIETAELVKHATAINNLEANAADDAAVATALAGKAATAHAHAAADVTSGTIAAARMQEVLVLNDLADALIATPGSSDNLTHDGTKWFNIKHIRRARAYAGVTADGATDDSTAIAVALSEINSAGRGALEFDGMKTYRVRNLPVYSDSIMDLCGSTLKRPDTSVADDDVFRTNGFDSLISGGTTGGVYRFKIMNGEIDGNAGGTGGAGARHGIASYGPGEYENLTIHDCRGNAIWQEWSSTGTNLVDLGLGIRDQTARLFRIEAYNCYGRVPVVGFDHTIVGGITGVTWSGGVATVTTAQTHGLRAGQVITIAGVLGATGMNGTQTVLAGAPSSATTFTVTIANPGAYTSGGTITYAPKACVLVKGSDSPHLRDLEIWQSAAGVVPGMRGLLVSSGGATGENIHVYQNFPTGLDVCGGSNSSRFTNVYVGGHDTGILLRQNDCVLSGMINTSFANSIGLDYQIPGGTNFVGPLRVNGLSSGSFCVRIWNTSWCYWTAAGIGDGGVNTSTLYVAPNGTGGFHGNLYNRASGVNASPATLSIA